MFLLYANACLIKEVRIFIINTMSKEKELSNNFIQKHLEENTVLCPHNNTKFDYFRQFIGEGYRQYKQNSSSAAGLKSLEEFAKEIINVHNIKIKNEKDELKRNYYKQDSYLRKIIKDKCASLISKNDPDHIFTYVNPKDDVRIDRLKEIINGYYKVIEKDTDKDVVKLLTKRILEQMVSGIRLLSVKHYADAFIIWRSLLENVSYFKILLLGGEKTSKKTANLFLNRKEATKKILGLSPSSSKERENITIQNENRNKRKSATWWEKQRFQWAANVLHIKDDLSAKTLQEAVGLDKYYPHYQVASIFTHEHLLTAEDFKVISLIDYLVNLYWRVFDGIRDDIIRLFAINRETVSVITSNEESLRKQLKSSREPFEEFANMIN